VLIEDKPQCCNQWRMQIRFKRLPSFSAILMTKSPHAVLYFF